MTKWLVSLALKSISSPIQIKSIHTHNIYSILINNTNINRPCVWEEYLNRFWYIMMISFNSIQINFRIFSFDNIYILFKNKLNEYNYIHYTF